MLRFLLGMMVGAVAAVWLQRTQNQELLERRLSEMQERANAMFLESRRVLEETRRELTAALETGWRTLETRTQQLRRGAEERPGEGPGPQPPTSAS